MSETPKKVIFWDFDGTLVLNSKWSRSIIDTLDERYPGHGITHDHIYALIRHGFPWHEPERHHPELSNSEAWWASVRPVMAGYCRSAGYSEEDSDGIARSAQQKILQPDFYTLYDDTLAVLEHLKEDGWHHFVLSNNFPELPEVVKNMVFGHLFDGIITSGLAGYDKPNPGIYRFALGVAGYPEKAWMVGDNIIADVRGAEAAGIPAILVREKPSEEVRYYAGNLKEAAKIIERNS